MIEQSRQDLLGKIEELQSRLDESEQLIEAIKAGEVDAFAIKSETGAQIYALQSGDYAYRVLIEDLEESALNVTEDGLIVYTNPYFCKFLQLSYEKVIGANILDFVHAGSRQEFSRLLRESNTGKSKGEINLEIHGKIVQVYISFTSLQRKLSTIGILITDLTEKIRTKQIEESERQLSNMADAMPQLVWKAAATGEVIYYNERVGGYAGAEKTKDGKWVWKEVIHEDDIKATNEAWENALASGTVYEIPHRIQMKDGGFRWHLSRGLPQKNEAGQIIWWYGTATDIHEQKVAEETIRESEERFRTLAETLPSLVWMTDEMGRQLYASERWERFTGIKPKNEETWLQVLHPDDVDIVAKAWAGSLQNGKGYHVDVRLRNRNNEYRWHYGVSEPLYNNDGEIIRWIGAFTDIQEQKIFAEKLEREVESRTYELLKINKELESFNYAASHDLQEPLRKIQTFINLLIKNKEGAGTLEKYAGKIQQAADRMSKLIQGVLEYSRISKSSDTFRPTDLNLVLENVKSDYELLIDERKVAITSGNLPTVDAIPLQMQQLFANLISNAIKFSDKTPVIKITADIVSYKYIPVNGTHHNKSIEKINPDQKYVALKFSDNGIGFDPHYSEKIFQLFQRLHGKTEYSGTGIGLSIVKKIVEEHNGFISADSVEGEGSAFNVWLPVSI